MNSKKIISEMLNCRASKFSKGYGKKSKSSGEQNLHYLQKYLILEALGRWKIHSVARGLPPYINANMVGIRSSF